MSISSWLNCDGLAIATPSMSTATEGSLLRACEMPRTVTNDVPWFCVCTSVMFGVRSMKSCGRSMPAACDVRRGEHVDRDRHVERGLVALARRDDDLLEAGRRGWCLRRQRPAPYTQSAATAASMSSRLSMFICVSPMQSLASSFAHDARAFDHGAQLRVGDFPRQVFHAAVRRDDDVLVAWTYGSARRMRAATCCGVSGIHVGKIDHAEQDLLAAQAR